MQSLRAVGVPRVACSMSSSWRDGAEATRAPRSTRKKTQRLLSDFGVNIFRAGNVDVLVVPRAAAPAETGGDQLPSHHVASTHGQYAADVERRHGVVAVPPWRNPLWLQQQQQQRGAASADAHAAAASEAASGVQTAAAADSDTAAASSQAAINCDRGGGAAASGTSLATAAAASSEAASGVQDVRAA